MELIIRTLAAAADEVRNELGNAQNAGMHDFIPAASIEEQINDKFAVPPKHRELQRSAILHTLDDR